ncbi:hypothetical protein HBB16_09655 [Pseudonocardia sp. MCCB 268]|nr:hypothetical protein [Pseudonocardia cytotoxica]
MLIWHGWIPIDENHLVYYVHYDRTSRLPGDPGEQPRLRPPQDRQGRRVPHDREPAVTTTSRTARSRRPRRTWDRRDRRPGHRRHPVPGADPRPSTEHLGVEMTGHCRPQVPAAGDQGGTGRQIITEGPVGRALRPARRLGRRRRPEGQRLARARPQPDRRGAHRRGLTDPHTDAGVARRRPCVRSRPTERERGSTSMTSSVNFVHTSVTGPRTASPPRRSTCLSRAVRVGDRVIVSGCSGHRSGTAS